jgi:hypothetical protein
MHVPLHPDLTRRELRKQQVLVAVFLKAVFARLLEAEHTRGMLLLLLLLMRTRTRVWVVLVHPWGAGKVRGTCRSVRHPVLA